MKRLSKANGHHNDNQLTSPEGDPWTTNAPNHWPTGLPGCDCRHTLVRILVVREIAVWIQPVFRPAITSHPVPSKTSKTLVGFQDHGEPRQGNVKINTVHRPPIARSIPSKGFFSLIQSIDFIPFLFCWLNGFISSQDRKRK